MKRAIANPTAWTLLAIVLGALVLCAQPASANHIPYTAGHVFAGVGNGKINRYTPTGTFVEQLDTLSGSSEQTGMCFDGNTPTANLRSTNFTANNMTRFNNLGGVVTFPWAGPFNADPESCVVSASGHIYVGQADGSRDILKFDASGTLVASFNVPTGPRGSDWIDLAADQATMFYTSEGADIRRYNVSTNTVLTNFNVAPLPTSPCFALRIRTNGEVLVACTNAAHRLSPTGTLMQSYPRSALITPTMGMGEPSVLFALNLDPDGKSFWTAGFSTGNIYRIDITTGAQIATFNAPPLGPTLAGLAIFGEPQVSLIGPPATLTLSPPAATNDVDTRHTVTATVKDANGNPVPNVVVRFSVTGSVTASGSCTTNINGQCSFTYTGPALPGADTITAFADTNNNGVLDAGEPTGAAAKVWTVPLSTPLCEVDVTYGGWIHADNGDKANFGGNAKADSQGNPQGQEEYQDKGPVQPMNVHSINVLAVVCPGNPPTAASIFGEATIDGAGSFNYRIDVEDHGEPGKGVDKYQIRLSNGYDSGDQLLEGGNVQIHK